MISEEFWLYNFSAYSEEAKYSVTMAINIILNKIKISNKTGLVQCFEIRTVTITTKHPKFVLNYTTLKN